MPNPIKPKRSYTPNSVPTTGDLQAHEMAINWNDGKIFTKDAGGSIVTLTLGGSGGSGGISWVTAPASATSSGTAGQVAYDGSYYYICTASNTWRRVAIASWSEDPYSSYVQLLLHMDGANNSTTFTDSSSSPKTVTAYGDAKISTTQSKFGGASAYFDGTGDYLSVPNTAFTLTGDFVIEGWVYLTSVSTYATLIDARSSAAYADWICGVYGTGGVLRPDFVTAGGAGSRLTGSSTSISLSTWTHIAFVRSSGTISAYVDGTRDAVQVSYSSTMTPGSALTIGRNVDGNHVTGYFDDLRITVNSNRGYTGATITVPTAAFPNP